MGQSGAIIRCEGRGVTDLVAFTVNGAATVLSLPDDTMLLDALRNTLGLTGSRFGCGVGACGSCMVLVDGAAQPSCTLPLWAVADKAVVTIEGLGTPERPHRLQTAFLDQQAGQCGYCLAGIIVSAAGLLSHTPVPSEAAVREALDRNLCRCGAHNRIVRAVMEASK